MSIGLSAGRGAVCCCLVEGCGRKVGRQKCLGLRLAYGRWGEEDVGSRILGQLWAH